MKRLCSMIVIVLFSCLSCYAYADSNAEEILKAVVKIKSVIPKDTPSTETLGTEREGSGMVIDAEGTILTISYLIRDAEKIEVIGPEGKSVSATFAGFDQNTGLAVLRTDTPLGVAPIELGQSSTVKVGDHVLVASFGGGGESVEAARVISRKEFAGNWEYLLDDAIFTVPAYADFSGAALIDREGHLVGVGSLLTQMVMEGFGLLPCNMFVPIDLLKPVLADLKTAGRPLKAQRPWLGINAAEAHDRIFITRITSGGPAEKAGLKPGDMVLMVDGKEVNSLSDFYRKIWGVGNAGVEIPLTILQGVKVREITVPSAERQRTLKLKSWQDVTL